MDVEAGGSVVVNIAGVIFSDGVKHGIVDNPIYNVLLARNGVSPNMVIAQLFLSPRHWHWVAVLQLGFLLFWAAALFLGAQHGEEREETKRRRT
jgi:uncharacterized membrane protein